MVNAAEDVYWMARHLERAEDTARLIRAACKILEDGDAPVDAGWELLLQIMGLEDAMAPTDPLGPMEVVRLLVLDHTNASGIVPSLRQSADNARQLGPGLPGSVHTALAELSREIDVSLREHLVNGDFDAWLVAVVRRCGELSSRLESGLDDDTQQTFYKLGALIERVDMTTRIVDLTTVAESPDARRGGFAASTAWSHVLDALDARATFAASGEASVTTPKVLAFVVDSAKFPRSLRSMLNALAEMLTRLFDPARPLRALRQVERLLKRHSSIGHPESLHDLMDLLQIRVAELHQSLTERYFQPEPV
ncbi:MAG: alpha-E domain-containing protein [Thiotrichales bacterium]